MSASEHSAPHTTAALLSALVATVDRADRSAFDALISSQDPGFPDTAGMIFDNLRAIHPDDLGLRGTGHKRSLSAKRATVLGKSAYAIEVRVSWSVPGDRAASDQLVWMTVVRSGGTLRWAGIADGPSTPRRTPLWWLEPVHYAHRGAVTVIAGQQIDVSGWLAAAKTAVTLDTRRLPDSGWNHRLVIIVPDNEKLLEQVIGDPPDTDSGLAAITFADGADAASAPNRILADPADQPGSLATSIVLSHETVHVATRSPASSMPSWLVEGFADDIAYLNYPAGAQPAAADLLAQVKRHGAPKALPGEGDFGAGHHDLNRSYAEAWLACRYLADRYGDAKLWRFYRAVQRSPDGAIAGPARSVFGISDHQLVAGWRGYLRRAADRGRI